MDLFVAGRDNSAADLSRFVVDLKERHLEYWIPYFETHVERTQQQTLHLSPMVCSSYKKSSGHSLAFLFRFMFLNLPRGVIRSTARIRLRVHTLRFETATWNRSNSPNCDLCDNDGVDMSNMSSMIFSTVPFPHDFSPQEICIFISHNRSSRCVYLLKPEQ